MGDHHHGHAVSGQLLHHLQHLAHHLGVQGGGRLVKQHHVGLHTQGADDGDALLLSAGKLLGIGIRPVAQAHRVQQAAGRGLGLLLGDALGVHGGQGQVFQHGHIGEQVEVLEHHAHFLPVAVQVGFFVGDVIALEEDAAGGGHLQQVQGTQHGGFAGAGRPHDDHHLAFADGQAAVVQGAHPVGEDLDHILHADQGVTGCLHGASSFRRPRWPCWRGN